jgi:hypothetical protein
MELCIAPRRDKASCDLSPIQSTFARLFARSFVFCAILVSNLGVVFTPAVTENHCVAVQGYLTVDFSASLVLSNDGKLEMYSTVTGL